MAKVIKLKAARVQDLHNLFNALSPQEISKIKSEETMKSIRFNIKLVDELEEANRPYAELIDKVNSKIAPVREEHLKKISEIRNDKELTDADREAKMMKAVETANSDISSKVDEYGKELGANTMADDAVSVTINSNERYDFLKFVFDKIAPEKFVNSKALIECADAIDSAVEA